MVRLTSAQRMTGNIDSCRPDNIILRFSGANKFGSEHAPNMQELLRRLCVLADENHRFAGPAGLKGGVFTDVVTVSTRGNTRTINVKPPATIEAAEKLWVTMGGQGPFKQKRTGCVEPAMD